MVSIKIFHSFSRKHDKIFFIISYKKYLVKDCYLRLKITIIFWTPLIKDYNNIIKNDTVKYFPFNIRKKYNQMVHHHPFERDLLRDRASIIGDTQEFNIMRNAKIYFIRTRLRIHYTAKVTSNVLMPLKCIKASMSFAFLRLFYRTSFRRVSLNTSAREAFELTIKILNPYVSSGLLPRY